MNAGKNRWERWVLFVLFLFSLSVFNLAGYLYPLAAVLVLLPDLGKIRISVTAVLLFLFSALYFGFYSWHYGFSASGIVLYLFGPWTAWLLGRTYVERGGRFLLLLAVPAVGMWLHGVLNLGAYLRSGYYAMYDYYRQSVDVWRGVLANVNATGMLFTFAAGLSVGVLFSGLRLRYKLAAGVILAVSAGVSVFFANRALLVILLLAALLCGLFGQRQNGKGKTVLFLLLGAAVLVIAAETDLCGFGTWLDRLKLVERIRSDSGDARFLVWGEFFARWNFAEHPWGGGAMLSGSDFSYFHNLWLDVYNRAGVLPFAALMAVTLCIVGQFFRFRRVTAERGMWDERVIFASLSTAIILNCGVEPILESNPYYFLILLMYFGAMEGLTKKGGDRRE